MKSSCKLLHVLAVSYNPRAWEKSLKVFLVVLKLPRCEVVMNCFLEL